MSKVALALKINVSQIDKARLFAGAKGQYLDCTIFVDLDQLDQYGNSGMITQDVSKEEKQQGVKGNILGNGKVFWAEGLAMPQVQGQQQQAPQPQQRQQPQQGYQNQQNPTYQQAPQQAPQPQQQAPVDFDDDIPF